MQGIIPDWPAFKHPCRVVESSQSSVIVERLHADYDDANALWVFTDTSAKDQQVLRITEIRVVCDTAVEVNSLIRKSRESIKKYYKERDRFMDAFAVLAEGDDKTPLHSDEPARPTRACS